MNKQLAELIILAASEREASYDRVASDEATKRAEKEREAQPDNLYVGFVDYSKFYRYSSLHEACEKVCPPELVEPVYLLLTYSWNDILFWASEQENTEEKI